MRFLRGFMVIRGGYPTLIWGIWGVRGTYASLQGVLAAAPDDPQMRHPTFAMSEVWTSEAFFPFSR